MIPFQRIVGAARAAGSAEAFAATHPDWALLVEAPGLSQDEVESPNAASGFRATRPLDKQQLADKLAGTPAVGGSSPDLWVAWLKPKKEGQRSLTIGRAIASDVLINHPSVSSMHALVSDGSAKRWYLLDQGSSLGTEVNGEAAGMGVPTDVGDGDVLTLGPDVRATVLAPESLYARARNPS